MGFFSGIKKAAKSITKAVKKVAKGIKKIGSKVWGGIKKGVGKIGEVFGKLGPIGTIAMSFAMPGIGSMLAGMWSTTASALAGSSAGWLQAVGEGMKWAATTAGKAKAFVGNSFAPITDKIKMATEYVGGKVSDGANYLLKGAQEFMGVENPKSIQDMGSWVGEKAESFFKSNPNKAADIAIKENTVKAFDPSSFTVDSGIYDPTNSLGVQDLIGRPSTPLSLQNQPLNVQYQSAARAGIDQATIDAARTAQISPFSKASQAIADQGIVPSGVRSSVLEAGTPKIIQPVEGALQADSGSSFLEKIAKTGAGLLGGLGAASADFAQPFTAGEVPDIAGAIRSGVGGTGAEGGEFLTEAQRRQQALFAQQLAQLG